MHYLTTLTPAHRRAGTCWPAWMRHLLAPTAHIQARQPLGWDPRCAFGLPGCRALQAIVAHIQARQPLAAQVTVFAISLIKYTQEAALVNVMCVPGA